MPGRRPMNASIGSGLRRWSLVRSAALRSGVATISAMRSRLIVVMDWHPAARTAANKANQRLIAILLEFRNRPPGSESQLGQRLQELFLLRSVGQWIGFQPPAARETGLQCTDLLRFPGRGRFVASDYMQRRHVDMRFQVLGVA